MQQTDIYINDQLSKAQALLWSGSLHEVDEAHNIIAKLINDRMGKSDMFCYNLGKDFIVRTYAEWESRELASL